MPAAGPMGYTCPKIDEAIKAIEAVHNAAMNLDDLLGHSGLMEKLRDANQALRTWGEEQEERADTAEAEVECLNSRVEQLESELEEAMAATQPSKDE